LLSTLRCSLHEISGRIRTAKENVEQSKGKHARVAQQLVTTNKIIVALRLMCEVRPAIRCGVGHRLLALFDHIMFESLWLTPVWYLGHILDGRKLLDRKSHSFLNGLSPEIVCHFCTHVGFEGHFYPHPPSCTMS
jgi:hypothetical protein